MANDPKAAGLPMAKIGEQLREAREKKSVTIDQVQKQTRIHSTVLKALEEGRCDGMLTTTYVKSFLKKYAEYLGLDARQMLNEYAKSRPAFPAQQTVISGKAEASSLIDISKLSLIARLAVRAAIIIAVVMFIGGKASNLLKHRKEPKLVASGKGPTTLRTAAVSPTRKAVINPSAAKKEPVSREQPVPKTIPIKTATAALEKQDNRAFQRNTQIYPIPKTTPIKLLLRANQMVLVKLRTDGNLLFSRVLPPGTVESFTAKDRINIYVAKAEAIELFLNGRSLGPLGKGLIKNIEITRSGLKIK